MATEGNLRELHDKINMLERKTGAANQKLEGKISHRDSGAAKEVGRAI